MWYRTTYAGYEDSVLNHLLELEARKYLQIRGSVYPFEQEVANIIRWSKNWLHTKYGKDKDLLKKSGKNSLKDLATEAVWARKAR